jgi:hypothetical protein
MVERIGYGTNFQRHVGRLMLFENTEVPRLDPVSIQTEGEVFSWETSGKIPAPNGLSGAPTIVTHPSGAVALFLPKTQQWRLIHLGIVPKLGWRVVEKAGLVRQTPDSNSQLITSDGLHGIAVSGMVFPGSTVNVIAVNKDWCTVSVGAMTGYLHRMALERSK